MARGAVGVAGDRSLMVLRAIEIEPEHRGVDYWASLCSAKAA